MSSRTRPVTTRRSFLTVLAGLGLAGVAKKGRTVAADVIDVRAVGAFGNGKASDLAQIQQAIRLAAERPAGATVFFPPGEYYLGASDDTSLLPVHNLRNTRFVGERATISCRSVSGTSNIFVFSAARDVTVEGLTFRDRGFKRDLSSAIGAVAIRFANEGSVGCQNVEVKNCRFESVLSAVTCRSFDQTGRARTQGIRLTELSVQHALYGFNFQDHGDRVVGRGLRCSDVKRSYFPYGVSDHDIELETTGNATGFTDVLIKCYHRETYGVRVRLRCRGKRGGDAIVALDQQHEKKAGSIRNVTLDLDIDDADCKLESAILIRALDQSGNTERQTTNRWSDISIDGDVRICDKTALIDIPSTGRTPGRLHIGPRLARHPKLPRSFPGFIVSGLS